MKARNVEDIYRLSPTQQGLLFHSLSHPGGGEYVVQILYRVDGDLDARVLERAWQDAMNRHPALRTSFHWQDLEEPVQVVRRNVELRLLRQDWRDLSPEEQRDRLRELLKEDRRRGYDLSEPPLMRLHLLRLGETTHQFIWSHHHLLLDGWSLAAVSAEIFSFYEAYPNLRDLRFESRRPFRDYILWLQNQDLSPARVFWQDQLRGFTEPNRLGVDRPLAEPLARGDDYRDQWVLSPESRLRALESLARSQQLPLNALVLGAWAELLARYGGRRDVVFGVVVSGRPTGLRGVEAMVGLFINTLPLRLRVPRGESARSWIASLPLRQAELLRFEHTPLSQIQEWSELAPGRRLFDTIFVFENYPSQLRGRKGKLKLSGVRMLQRTNYPITLQVTPQDGISLLIRYDRNLFDDSTVARMLRHLDALLGALADASGSPLESLGHLSAAERHQLVTEWNDTARRRPGGSALVHRRFEVWAEEQPEAPAVVFEERELAYRELNARANQLARRLRALGVGPETPVAICLDRSWEVVLAILGVFKAGGAYVPLDPSLPPERLAFTLEDSGARVAVSTTNLVSRLPEGASVVRLDAEGDALRRLDDTNLAPAPEPGNLAYVIYTSGSTGRPKGVAVEHRQLGNYLDGVLERLAPPRGAHFAMVTTPAADLGHTQVFGSLAAGGCLHVLSEERAADPVAFAEYFERRPADALKIVPSHLAALLTLPRPERIPPRSLLVLGGEAFNWELREKLRSLAPGCRVFNHYGPSESTVGVLTYAAGGRRPARCRTVPLGRPIGNVAILLLDRWLEPVPAASPGELVIGGAGLARGYVARPVQTAGRFVPCAFGVEPGARLYRTGDLARRLPGGEVEFLGRVDHQVKIRGFRIEPGEIENVLRGLAGVENAAVLARPEKGDLVAYVAASRGASLSADGLRSSLAERLPAYMVPGTFVFLGALPVTANGKLDRRALPSPEATGESERPGYVAPRTAEEEKLAAVWSEVFGRPVGIHDDFFELGGDSILSIQIVGRATGAGLRLSPGRIFEHPTIAELASHVDSRGEVLAEQAAVSGEVPLTAIQRRFLEGQAAELRHYNQAVLLETADRLEARLLEAALTRLLEHHDALRLRLRRDGGGWRQEIVGPHAASVAALDLTRLPPSRFSRAVEEAAARVQGSLDPLSGPLLRAVLFHGGQGRPGRFLLAVHHLAVDGVSWRILLEDLQRLYRQLEEGAPPRLPPKTTSFRRWAERVVEHARSPQRRAELRHWLETVRPERGSLPVDFPAGKNLQGASRTVTVSLPEAETGALLHELSARHRTSIEDHLLAALALGLRRSTGRGSLLVDLEGHGREELFADADVSRTVGWFTSVFPVRLDLRDARRPVEALRAVKDELRRVPDRGIGYGLSRYLDAEGEGAPLARGARAEVSFNYLGQLDQVLSGSALFAGARESVGPLRSPRGRRRYLLEVTANVSGERLWLVFRYGGDVHRRETVEALAGHVIDALRSTAAALEGGDSALTPADFPAARLDQEELDRLVPGAGPIEDALVLSPMQKGMLFHTLAEPGGAAYVEQMTCSLRGDLDVEAFKKAWGQVLARHPSLRASFHWDGLREPHQLFHLGVELPFREIDWRHLKASEQQERLGWLRRVDGEEGFELSRAPLLRLALVHLGGRAHFVWSHHHLLFDGWSLAILLKEVFQIYRALSAGRSAQLPAVPSYAEYLRWLGRQDMARAEEFWRRTLEGFSSPTPLAYDRPGTSPGEGTPESGRRDLVLDRDVTARLSALAGRHKVTPATVVQGAWALLLAHYSGRREVLFGVTVAGRPAAVEGCESIVGLFINTLPARCRVPWREASGGWLRDLLREQTEAREYDYSPLFEIHGWSRVPRDRPLFESLLVFENYPVDEALADSDGDLEVRDLEFSGETNYPLTVIAASGDRLALAVSFDARRFSVTSIERLMGHLGNLLREMAADRDRPLAELALLSPAQRHQVVTERAATVPEPPGSVAFEELLARQARRSPDAVAVCCGHRRLTYGALDESAARLAGYLEGLGVGAEDRVGLSVERSPEMVIGLLAILKTGAAYVPLDPEYPAERLAFILADARVRWVLARGYPPSLSRGGVETISLDPAGPPFAGPRLESSTVRSGPGNAAYVIYTSGSTGRPKGVLVERRALSAFVAQAIETYGLEARDRVLQFHSLSFDVSAEEIFAALAVGATLVLRTDSMIESFPGFLAFCRSWQLTLVALPTAFFHELTVGAEAADLEDLSPLRMLVFAGEKALPERVRLWREVGDPRVRVLNTYGPTEATVVVTAEDVAGPAAATLPIGLFEVSIGHAMKHVRAYVVDRRLRPVPLGVAGELCLAGSSLARGYLERPAKTAEQFVPDPCSPAPAGRLYRTGDLVRTLADGRFEVIGRADQQVKIRGFRIEPGEIEALLAAQPGVRSAAVETVEAAGGERRLIAYAAPIAGSAVTSEELRDALESRLPSYMVPTQVLLLESLPLLPSGKVDRRSLPVPELSRSAPADDEAPRSATEELLAEIWAETLGAETVGVHDNFFDLGGHSLLATRLVSRIRRVLGVEVALRRLFEEPTVRGLAAVVEAERAANRGPAAPPLVRARRGGDLPLSFAQSRLWFLDQLNPGGTAYNMPAAVRVEGDLDVASLRAAFSEIVRRHEVLRTRFEAVDGKPVQRITAAGGVDLPVVDLQGLAGEAARAELARLAAAEAATPFDLGRGPLLRTLLLKRGPQDHTLLWTLHHIASDGWSAGVLLRELTALYRAFAAGEPSPLAELTVQYADFAAWQRGWLRGDVLESKLDYWRRRLTGAPALLEVPTDRPRPATPDMRSGRREVAFDAATAERLRRFSRRQGLTLFMSLLSGFGALLSRCAGRRDVSVGTPIANRTHAEIEGLIGFFVNTLVMRLEVAAELGFRELAAQAREVALGAYAHQELPFEKLVEEIEPDRQVGISPLFQVMLVVQNAPRASERVPGLDFRLVPTALESAKFDLTLTAAEGAEGGLDLVAVYRRELFDGVRISRFLEHLVRLIAEGVAAPSRPLSELSLLTAAERHQLLREWGDGDRPPPVERLEAWFSARATGLAEAVAVVSDAAQLTYREIELRSDRLAHRLRRAGVAPEDRVAICLDRCPEMIWGILGVLKARAAYVPLDPGQPPSRRRAQLRASGAGVVLSRAGLVDGAAADGVSRLLLDREAADSPGGATAPPAEEAGGAAELAYVIFTSGSTGEPKGVMVEHRQIVGYLKAFLERVELAPGERFALVQPWSVDAVKTTLYAALVSGGRLELIQEHVATDPAALWRTLEERSIDWLKLTPSHLSAVLDAPARAVPRRFLVLGGEAASREVVRRFRDRAPGCEVINQYGPAETTVGVTTHRDRPPDRAAAPAGAALPLGRALPGNVLYTVDRHLRSLPIGVPGELCVGGRSVSRGYLAAPALTAERFLPDPFAAGPGSRLYRTGDLARWRGEGTAEFLGRLDHQVKVRGFRVEPGELEAALLRHPSVREAAVAAHEVGGDVRLTAYLVVAAGRENPAAELRDHLRGLLPEALVPRAFVVLEALPRTAGGKVDRRALPEPQAEGASSRPAEASPRTGVEELLASIFADVLGVASPGVFDDFFDLGGHSLLATLVVSRVRRAFGVEVALRRLFETPTIAGLAAVVEEALRGARGTAVPPLIRVPRGAGMPLSFAQQRMWFLAQLEPESPAYNIPAVLRVEGDLDPAVLGGAFAEIVRRHEILRTRFVADSGEPRQVVEPAGPASPALIDLSALPPGDRERVGQALVRAEALRAFALSSGEPLRIRLVRLAEDDHLLSLVLHHIVSDGWSTGILVRELAVLYRAGAAGRPSPLPELDVQYADFAVWQRSWLTGEVLEAELGHWRRRLAGAPAVIELPTDRPRPPLPSVRGARRGRPLSDGVSAALKAFSSGRGLTLFMTILSGFGALLSRYSGQTDLTLGSPIANRTRSELEGLIGFFVNTLVLRLDLAGQPTFEQLTARVREVALEAYTHQDVPFEKLVEELDPHRDLGRSPLFQVFFVLQNVPRERLEVPGLAFHSLTAASDDAKFDLTLSALAAGDRLVLSAGYRRDLFDATRIDRLLGHLARLIEEGVAAPERPLAELALLSFPERHQMLREWSSTGVELAGGVTVHGLLARQAAATPDALAVVFEDQALSYRELGRRSDGLARHLRGLGVAPEEPVGICAERSLEMVVGLLGILKAEGAYVPLDPDYPAERLRYLASDAGARWLLVQDGLGERLPGKGHIRLGATWDDSGADEGGVGDPSRLAYVIYTSGSTGRPKGVMNSHRGIVNRLLWMQREYCPLTAGDRVLQKTPYSFDVSVWEFFWPLASGARLVLARPGGHRDPSYLVRTVVLQAITTAHFVPSMLRAFLAEDVERCRTLRRVIASGEALACDLEQEWLRRHPAALINLYGPTEAAVEVTAWRCRPSPLPRGVPIGFPVANTRLPILDAAFRPAPLGVAGELAIGGVQVARGYLRRPALTAERFVPDPLVEEPGARLYRTGDLARYLSSGAIEYLGRLDHQVKVRGFRIELGEIESVLRELSAVREAVVVAREMSAGDRRLVGYAVPEPGARLDEAALRLALEERLPEHMVPARFVFLDALPLLPSGKIDRRSLPEPERQRRLASRGTPARTPTEQLLVEIWTEVLGVETPDVFEDFFALGGHSLLATRLMSRVRRVFEVELPLRLVFEAPTVAGLARTVEAARRAADAPQAPPLERVPRDGGVPLSFAQLRLWFLDQLEPENSAYNIPAALRINGRLDVAALAAALGEVVRRHEILRTRFVSTPGGPLQVVEPPYVARLPMIDLSALPAPEREPAGRRLMAAESRRPFDLSSGRLLRARILRLGAGEHLLVLVQHHIVSDGWSAGVLVRELGTLYRAAAAGEAPDLPELPIQYADHAAWQRTWLQGEVLERQVDFWRQRLAGAPAVLELPADRPRPAVRDARGAQRTLPVPPRILEGLRAYGREEGLTLFMTLLAGLTAVLGRWTGRRDIVVGCPIANRTRSEIEGLIGFFVNTLVLRLELSGAPTFAELARRAKELALDAFAHQDLPFEKLVEELEPERDLSRSPLFQVMLVLQNVPREPLAVPGLTFEALDVTTAEAKLDLTVTALENGDRLALAATYRRDIFDGVRIDRFLRHLVCLLHHAVAEPGRPHSELPLLSPTERHQLLREWGPGAARARLRTGTELREAGHGLDRLVVDQAARSPDAVAISCDDRQLTYGEVDRQSNRLAHYLRGTGVGRETRVGICLEPSPELVVGILGVLKAGGAYFVLPADAPRHRRRAQLRASRAPVVLTRAGLAEGFRDAGTRTLSLFDRDASELSSCPEAPLEPVDGAGHLAYVIFTSGSTGEPKGVMVEHRQITGYLAAFLARVRPLPGRRYAWVQPAHVDASKTFLYAALTTGGRLEILAREVATDPSLFWKRLAERSSNWLKLSPSHLAAVLPGAPRRVPIDCLVLGGEALAPELARSFREIAPGSELINQYGPAETTVGASLFRWSDAASVSGSVPIGRALPLAVLYVLDRRLRPVPPGVAGELCVGGGGVTRGYQAAPGPTAQRFLPDAYVARSGRRLYRTGDLGRWLGDGTPQFLGRIDHQIKVRGFRVEPGDVEATLRRHPRVRDAVVVARTVGRDLGLVAYVASSADPGAVVAELRELVADRLPDYMVPRAFVCLASLPRTPAGKVDRGALPAPDPGAGTGGEAPRTPLEEIVLEIWSEVLGVAEVGTTESFFELGGHSLLATRLISRLRQVFEVEISLRRVFETPTVVGLASAIAKSLESGSTPAAPPLVPAGRDGRLPLSFAQERLWFIAQLQPDSPAYNIPAALRIEGRLDLHALTTALGEIARRHEVLRTRFADEGGRPLPVVERDWRPGLPLIDLSALPPGPRQAIAGELTLAEARRPFDLTAVGLLRARLVRLAEDDHLLLVSVHHIVADAWSTAIFVRELGTLYRAFSAREPSPLPELPIQYSDFAVWQRGWLRGDVLAAELDHWRRRLAGAPPVLELATDRARPALQSMAGGRARRVLGEPSAAGLTELGRRRGLTLFMTLLAGFGVLLSRYAGQSRVVVGTPIANRNRAETEGLIGFFVNALALPIDPGRQPSFLELAGRVKETALEAFTHQDVPFEKLVQELVPDRDLGRSPLFQVTFALQNAPQERLEAPGLSFRRVPASAGEAKFDLTLVASEEGGDLALTAVYRRDLFDEVWARRFLDHLSRLLEGAVAAPHERIAALPILGEAERHQLVREWSSPAPASDLADRPVPALFASWARRFPDASALASGDRWLSYGELETRSDRLAEGLRGLGIGPERRVGVFLERSPEMVVALLGVLRSGAAYLPLDPRYPRERLAFMIEDASVAVVLTRKALRDTVEGLGSRLLLLAEESDGSPAGTATRAPATAVGRDHVAYVIYTSGSTGRPKGVEVSHGALSNLVRWHWRAFEVTRDDRATQVAGPAFDASVWELWPYLSAGASVHLPEEDLRTSPAELLDWLLERAITITFLPTPLAEGMLSLRPAAAAPARILTGGDRLHRRPLASHRFELVNNYGPTENAVVATSGRVVPGDAAQMPSIGRPIDGAALAILDAGGRPAPLGVPGELCLAGESLARGYLRRAAMTGEKFVPDPSARRPGRRRYRTGDLARFRRDGEVEFLGRVDHQVKVRGFRIELGEIEAVLAEHPRIEQAVATVRQGRLVAYLAAGGEDGPDSREVRALLAERLPDYMVPAVLVRLDALPLTPNGKVDRRALPEPDPESAARTDFVPPGTPVERELAGIWSDVLGIERIGVHDDFFQLGGHSLLATRVLSRVRQSFAVERLPLRRLFEKPTVSQLAVEITRLELEQSDEEEVARMLAEIQDFSAEELEALLEADLNPDPELEST